MRRCCGGSSVPNVTTEKLAQWRREIVEARIRLDDDDLPNNLQRLYWTIVDCRETCIRLSDADFEAELELIDREIEAALRPWPALSHAPNRMECVI